MSMVVCFDAVSGETIDRLMEFPPLVWKVIAPGDPEPFKEATKSLNPGFISKLLGRKSVVVPELPADPPLGGDLDKAWHGLHYLLTGTAWDGEPPLNFLVGGGEEVGDVDVGYGPARAYRAADVVKLSGALSEIDVADLRARFNPAEMMKQEIYPGIWDRDPSDDDTLGYCLDNFESLKRFLAEAVRLRRGMLIYLC